MNESELTPPSVDPDGVLSTAVAREAMLASARSLGRLASGGADRRWIAVNEELAGVAQFIELARDTDGLWWAIRQVDGRDDHALRFAWHGPMIRYGGMLSDAASTEADLADPDLCAPITAHDFERRWSAAR